MLKGFFKKYGWWYLPGMLFLFIGARLKTSIPNILGSAIDLLSDVANVEAGEIYTVAIRLFFTAVGVFCSVFVWRMCVIGNGRRLERHLRTEFFKKLQSLPEEFFERRRSGDLLSYVISDTNAVRMAFGSVLALGINGILTALFSILSMAGEVDPRLAFFALIPVPLAVACLVLLGQIVRRRFSRVQQLFSGISGFVNESIMGIKVIKTFAREEERHDAFNAISDELRDAHVKLVNASSLISPTVSILFGCSYLISIIYGSGLVLGGSITVGDLAAFLSYLALVQTPVTQFGKIINNVQRGVASYRRLKTVMDEPSIPQKELEFTESVSGDIEVKHLTFRYTDAEEDALRDVSFTLKQGQKLGIAGTTGCGKTTLLSLLLKFYEPPRGCIFIGGRDICDIPAANIRRSTGYVMQDGFLFSDTVSGNISFYSGSSEGQIEHAADLADVAADIVGFSDGYETAVGERGTRLSGGQKQRISLARALVRDPAMLFLDDTLSAVDNLTEEKIIANLNGVLKSKTAIIISHRLSAIKDCDLILYMDNGVVTERGTHDELMKMGGSYAAAYNEQAEVDHAD
ncbi:MAG: ABC transporter ATP-binding protein [Clostridia bacterium]|nr:ABC transporter ATP-binding protein [Clostridia bacterium]